MIPCVSRLLSFENRVAILLAILMLGVNVFSVSSHLGFLHKPKQVKELDHWRYIEMAKGSEARPVLARQSTYCWRVFTPFVAGLLYRAGLSMNLAFFVVTNVFLFAFLLAVWAYLAALGLGLASRATGLVLVGLTQGAVRWYEYQYWMTDPPSLFLLVLALLLVRRERLLPLYPLGALAALVREHNVVVVPFQWLQSLKRGVPFVRATAVAATLAVLPLAVLWGLRRLIVPVDQGDMLADMVDTLGFRWRHREDQLYQLSVGALGVVFPLLLLLPARVPGMIRRNLDSLSLVAFFYGLLLVANNTEREIAYALPVLLAAALVQLRDYAREARLPVLPLAALAVALQALFFFEQRFLDAGSSMYQPTNMKVVGAMVAFWLAAQGTLWIRRRAGAP
jgi:hypothetical protein